MKWLEISPIKKYSWLLPLVAIISLFIYHVPKPNEGLGGLGWAIMGFYIIPVILAIISFTITLIESIITKRERKIIKSIGCMLLSIIIYFIFLFITTNIILRL